MTGRDRTVLIVVAVIAALVGSWMLLIQPKRNEASKLGGQVSAEQSQLSQAQAEVAAGQAAKRSYAAFYTSLARLGEAVPADDNVPSLLYQLQNAASATKVDFQNFVLTTGGSTTGSSSSSTLSTATLPPGATIGSAGLPIEPFTLTFDGNYFHLASFLGKVQKFVTATNNAIAVRGRLMTLNAINIGPGPKGFPQIAVSISATTYLAPASSGVLGGGTPSGPSASASSPVSSGATGTGSSSEFPTAAVTP